MVDVPAGLAAWHETLTARDASRLPSLIAAEATFRSPALYRPVEGRDAVAGYLTAAFHVLGGDAFHYEREWTGADSAVLEFVTELDGRTVHGIDMITWGDDGLIRDFTVMIRPLKTLQQVVERMGAELARMLTAG